MAENTRSSDKVDGETWSGCRQDRRRFLQNLCVGAMATVGAQAAWREARAAQDEGETTKTAPGKLPTIKIGDHHLTRLIAGSNPIEGFSHTTRNLTRHMLEYFTLDKTVEFISHCEQLGINTWQSGHGPSQKVIQAVTKLREQGSNIQWMCLFLEKLPIQKSIKDILPLKPIAIIHHGGATDSLFRAGQPDQIEKVHDFVKKVHDAGVLAGISAHNPANIAYIEEKGWENDFFMTCLYHISRPDEEIRQKLGTIQLGEPFLESDPDEMTKVIRQVKRPCLAFKLLAAGRKCWSDQSVEEAFKYAFGNIKKIDGVIVGMYPRFIDEADMNVGLTLKYANLSI